MSKQLKVFILVFFSLGIIAFIIGDRKQQNPDDMALTFSEFDEIISNPINQISAIDLANLLLKQEHHYNLIDLQSQPASYQIPTAENHTLQSFLAKKIAINESIFLYSKFESQALQLYYLLNLKGYFKVKILTGGLASWYEDVLQPDISKIAKDEIQQRRTLTEYFGGSIGSTHRNIEIKKVLLSKKIKKHHGC